MDDEQKVVRIGADARDSIRKVLKVAKAAVSSTLGPKGRNALIDRGRNDRSPLITNDGKTIIKSMRLNGPVKVGSETIECAEAEDKVLATLFEIANMTDMVAGDGTTTATTLGIAITEDCLERISDDEIKAPGAQNDSPMALAGLLEAEKNEAVALLQAMSEPVDTLDKLRDVAFTSLENKEIADIVAEAMFKIGKDGFARIEEGYDGRVETDVISGIQIYGKVAASFGYTNDKRQAIVSNTPVLVTNGTLANLIPLQKLLEDWGKSEDSMKFTSFVIMAAKFEAPALRQILSIERKTLEKTQGASSFRIFPVKIPSLTDDEIEDVAAYLDAKFINTDAKVGDKLEKVRFADLGFAEQMVAGDDETVFTGGRGLKTMVTNKDAMDPMSRVHARLQQMEDTLTVENDTMFKNKLQRRIEILSGGIAVIRVGAPTDTEKAYLKLKIEDAKNACKCALQEGMIPGAGRALAAVADKLGSEALLYRPLRSIQEQIETNAGMTIEVGENIKDPTKVVRCAVESAVSVAKVLITTETIIADKRRNVSDELSQMLNV